MCPTQEQFLLLPARRLQAQQVLLLQQRRRRRRQLYCKDDHGSRPVEAASSVSSGSSSWQALLCRHKDTLTTYLLTYLLTHSLSLAVTVAAQRVCSKWCVTPVFVCPCVPIQKTARGPKNNTFLLLLKVKSATQNLQLPLLVSGHAFCAGQLPDHAAPYTRTKTTMWIFELPTAELPVFFVPSKFSASSGDLDDLYANHQA